MHTVIRMEGETAYASLHAPATGGAFGGALHGGEKVHTVTRMEEVTAYASLRTPATRRPSVEYPWGGKGAHSYEDGGGDSIRFLADPGHQAPSVELPMGGKRWTQSQGWRT